MTPGLPESLEDWKRVLGNPTPPFTWSNGGPSFAPAHHFPGAAVTISHLEREVKAYLDLLTARGAKPIAMPDSPQTMDHAAYMCREILVDFIPNNRIEKAMRWLGFVQRALVGFGVFTLNEVKQHSRPLMNEEPDKMMLAERVAECEARIKMLVKSYGGEAFLIAAGRLKDPAT